MVYGGTVHCCVAREGQAVFPWDAAAGDVCQVVPLVFHRMCNVWGVQVMVAVGLPAAQSAGFFLYTSPAIVGTVMTRCTGVVTATPRLGPQACLSPIPSCVVFFCNVQARVCLWG